MIDLIYSLCLHLQADTALLTILGNPATPADQIGFELDPSLAAPQIAVSEQQRVGNGTACSNVLVRFHIRAGTVSDTDQRSTVVAARKRLYAMFHEQWDVEIASGGNLIRAVNCEYEPNGILAKSEEGGFYECEDDYLFIIPTES